MKVPEDRVAAPVCGGRTSKERMSGGCPPRHPSKRGDSMRRAGQKRPLRAGEVDGTEREMGAITALTHGPLSVTRKGQQKRRTRPCIRRSKRESEPVRFSRMSVLRRKTRWRRPHGFPARSAPPPAPVRYRRCRRCRGGAGDVGRRTVNRLVQAHLGPGGRRPHHTPFSRGREKVARRVG